MDKKKLAALSVVLGLSGLLWACGNAPETPKNTNAAAKNAAPPANKPETPPTTAAVAGMPDDVAAIFSKTCGGCHGPDAKGTKIAPNIFEVKEKHTAEEWLSYLRNPKIFEQDNTMGAISEKTLADPEAKKVAEWLAVTTGKGGAATDAKMGDDKGEKSDEKKDDDHGKGDDHGKDHEGKGK